MTETGGGNLAYINGQKVIMEVVAAGVGRTYMYELCGKMCGE